MFVGEHWHNKLNKENKNTKQFNQPLPCVKWCFFRESVGLLCKGDIILSKVVCFVGGQNLKELCRNRLPPPPRCSHVSISDLYQIPPVDPPLVSTRIYFVGFVSTPTFSVHVFYGRLLRKKENLLEDCFGTTNSCQAHEIFNSKTSSEFLPFVLLFFPKRTQQVFFMIKKGLNYTL